MFPSKPWSLSSDRNLLERAITLSNQNMQSQDILLHCAKIFKRYFAVLRQNIKRYFAALRQNI